MQSQYNEVEMKTRMTWAQKILIASRDIRNLPPLDGKRLQDATQAWEAAFLRIATPQLPELYKIGLAKKCATAAEFQEVWEMKCEAEWRAAEHKKLMRDLPPLRDTSKPVVLSPEVREITERIRRNIAEERAAQAVH